MKKYIFYLLFSCFLNSLVAQNYPYYQQKTFRPEDITYSPNIRTILLYPYGNTDASLTPPIVPLYQQNLRLEFDDLNTNGTRYTAKIISCDKDWQVTTLNNIEYLDVVNEFYINDREMSYNTKVAYQHYWLDVPAVKISGNYVLKVYENGYEDRLVFCRRFMITEGGVGIAAQQNLAIGGSSVFNNQQIDFQLNYGNYDIPNPMQQV
ncbi:MAG: type IX secretion system plug protein domain-containing protein, partial [Thermoflexibacteraceae bacterium]